MRLRFWAIKGYNESDGNWWILVDMGLKTIGFYWKMNTETGLKYFLYARKSSEAEDRQVASIDAQINELERIAERDGLKVVKVFSEARSAKEPGRLVFGEMLSKIYKGEAHGILCWKLDRLARNPVDGGQINWMLQQGIIRHIKSFDRDYYPSDNVLMMSVEFGMANQFIRDLSENTKRGLRAKAERGWYPVYSTLGYIHNPLKRKGEKEIIKDNDRFELVRKMFDLMLTGRYSVPKIWEIATKEWGLKNKSNKKVSRSTVYRIFTDPFYYGEFEWPKGSGNWIKGQHEAMITEEEYDKIQIILGRKGKPRPKTHSFAYTGLIKCGECGAMITAEDKVKNQKNGNVHRYVYYHCTKRLNPDCSQKNVRLEDLEEQIAGVLRSIEIPKEFGEWAIEQLNREGQKETQDRNLILSNLQRQYSKCIQKIDSLIDLRASGEINEEEFRNKRNESLKEKERLQELLNDTDNRVNKWMDKAEEIFNFAEIAPKRFQAASMEDKRGILDALGSNLTLKDRKLSISLMEPLILMKDAAEEVRKITNRLEPPKTLENKRTLEEVFSQSPKLLRG